MVIFEFSSHLGGNHFFFFVSLVFGQKLTRNAKTQCFSTFAIFSMQPLWILIQGWKRSKDSHYICGVGHAGRWRTPTVSSCVNKWTILHQKHKVSAQSAVQRYQSYSWGSVEHYHHTPHIQPIHISSALTILQCLETLQMSLFCSSAIELGFSPRSQAK